MSNITEYQIATVHNSFMSSEIDKIGLALSKVQGEIKNVKKTKQAHNHKYADLAACLDAVIDILSKYQISIIQPPTFERGHQLIETVLIHEGQWLRSTICMDNLPTLVKGNVVQSWGAALTYYRRYALAAMVGLAQEDDDAECLSVKASAPQARVTWTEPPKQDDAMSLSKELMRLCEENDIKLAEFTTLFAISSKDKESVKNAVAKFDQLKEDFKQMRAEA